MRDLYLAEAPSTIPAPISELYSPWPGVTVTWRQGETAWDLNSPRSGVCLLQKGVRGLSMPPIKRRTSSFPGLHGSRFDSWIADEREAFWPLLVWNDESSQDWIKHDRAFWSTMHPDKTGTWRVAQPNGDYRELTLRYAEDGGHAFDRDPVRYGWATYGLTMVAEDPFWQGQQIKRAFGAATKRNFFGGGAIDGSNTSKGSPFYISAGSSMANSTIPNPGDVEAWPVWRVVGPFSAATVAVDGHQIRWPGAGTFANNNHVLRIDTRPEAQAAIYEQTGEDFTWWLDRTDFAAIPPGESRRLDITLEGSGYVECSLTPRYMKAW